MNNLLSLGFKQAAGVVLYITLVAFVMQNGERVFGSMDNFIGPIVFLTLFSVSALICAMLTLWNSVQLFWIKKKPAEAMRLVGYTTLFLALFVLIMFAVMILT